MKMTKDTGDKKKLQKLLQSCHLVEWNEKFQSNPYSLAIHLKSSNSNNISFIFD